MKTCFISILLIVSIFNMPLLVSAERENSELAKIAKLDAETDAKKDVIIETARRDATANTSELWYLGCLMPPTGMGVGLWTGLYIGHSIDPAVGWEILSGTEACGILTGATIGCLTPLTLTLIHTHNNKPVPNPEALLGRSPEYVAIYTAAYQKRSNYLKRVPVISGTAASVFWMLLGIVTG